VNFSTSPTLKCSSESEQLEIDFPESFLFPGSSETEVQDSRIDADSESA
jgi:hypothetical protein